MQVSLPLLVDALLRADLIVYSDGWRKTAVKFARERSNMAVRRSWWRMVNGGWDDMSLEQSEVRTDMMQLTA